MSNEREILDPSDRPLTQCAAFGLGPQCHRRRRHRLDPIAYLSSTRIPPASFLDVEGEIGIEDFIRRLLFGA